MPVTIQTPESFTAQVRGQAFKVDAISTMPAASLAKIFEYGLQRIFNDAAAGATGDTDEAKAASAIALASKRLDNLRAGVIRAAAVRNGDPVEAEAMRIAREKVETAIKAKGIKLADVKSSEITRLAKEALDKNPSFREIAKANVEAAKGLDLGDLDLDFTVGAESPAEQPETDETPAE